MHLLNQYYRNDTAARLRGIETHGWNAGTTDKAGYLKETDFISAGTEIGLILDTLPILKPFDQFNIDGERNRISDLFSENNAKQIADFFHRRSIVESRSQIELDLDLLPPEYDKKFFKEANILIADISDTLAFYNAVSDDMREAFIKLQNFVTRVDEMQIVLTRNIYCRLLWKCSALFRFRLQRNMYQ